MKKNVITFLIISASVLMALPIYNLFQWNKGLGEYLQTKQYYKLDSIVAPISNILSNYGISLFPDQVIVGHDGWLFLGDQEAKTVSTRRQGATENDIENAQKIALSVKEWNDFFLENGVKKFKILIGPDKENIYPENLPQWAHPASFRQISAVVEADKNGIFVDPTDFLIAQKNNFKEPLYYKTDTHWNALGGWLAFNYFMDSIFNDKSFSSENTGHYVGWHNKSGGDLSRFLRTENLNTDHYQDVDVISKENITIKKHDLASGSLISSSTNMLIDAPDRPTRISSSNASHNAKVLWLRDSFGTAMSPFMAAHFTETVQLHYFGSDPEWLYNVIKKYKPDYVFVTTVERSIINNFFLSPPPLYAYKAKNEGNGTNGSKYLTHDVTESKDGYKITGNDPFVAFIFNPPLNAQKNSDLYLNVNCNNSESTDLFVQIFWSSVHSSGFSEENSISISLPQNGAIFNMSKLANWTKSGDIEKVRFDIQPKSIESCKKFNIEKVQLLQSSN